MPKLSRKDCDILGVSPPGPESKVYHLEDLCRLFDVSRETLAKLLREGHIPAPLPLPGRPKWARPVIDQIFEWNAAQAKADAAAGTSLALNGGAR